jgi:hypothetical protein
MLTNMEASPLHDQYYVHNYMPLENNGKRQCKFLPRIAASETCSYVPLTVESQLTDCPPN